MTKEEFEKLAFSFVSHLSMHDEYCTIYKNDEYGIYMYAHVKIKDGEPKGKSYNHFMYQGKLYKTPSKFLEAIKEL